MCVQYAYDSVPSSLFCIYSALKKEIEQIERGELDSELPRMWEKIQA